MKANGPGYDPLLGSTYHGQFELLKTKIGIKDRLETAMGYRRCCVQFFILDMLQTNKSTHSYEYKFQIQHQMDLERKPFYKAFH